MVFKEGQKNYLYISYNSDKNLKDCQWYKCLDEVKKERGITCNAYTLSLARVGSWTSPDGSGCYLLDFQSDMTDGAMKTMYQQLIDTKWSSHVISLLPCALRELKLNKLLQWN